MKKSFSSLLLSFLFVGVIFAQKDSNFLKNYKAPDFTFQSLITDFGGKSKGNLQNGSSNSDVNFRLSYFRLKNTRSYQGNVLLSLSDQFDLTSSRDSALNRIIYNGTGFSSIMQNRYYKKKNWFIGFHDYSHVNYSVKSIKIGSFNNVISSSFFSINPAVSIGKGRLEIVNFARTSMDIEKLLSKGGRIKSLSDEERTLIANKIAEINNNRYFDDRLGRIYRLEALDSILNNEGLVNNRDMRYFSLLQDAYLYSYFVPRYSGFRQEFGINEGISYFKNSPDSSPKFEDGHVNSYLFYNLKYCIPASYLIQHDYSLTIAGGVYNDIVKSTPYETPLWITADYTLGYYPSTRTYLSANLHSSYSHIQDKDGIVIGSKLNAYYYFSPQLRLTSSFGVNYGENYSLTNFSHFKTGYYPNLDDFTYDFSVGLNYAIF